MKTEKVKWGLNTKTLYHCDTCNNILFEDPSDYSMDDYEVWKFCPYCGEPINYNNTKLIDTNTNI